METKINGSMSARDLNWDFVKGIGILLVVIGHSGCPTFMRSFIFMFHMGLFFFVSGRFVNAHPISLSNKSLQGGGNACAFIKKKLKALYLPFVYWGLIFVLLHNIFYQWGWNETPYNATDYANKIIGTLLFKDVEPMLVPLWFLKSLFCGLIVCYFVSLIKQKCLQWAIIIVLYTTGWLISDVGIHLFSSIERELVVSSVVCMGMMMKHIKMHTSIILAVGTFAVMCLMVLFVQIEPAISIFSYYGMFPLAAMLGVFLLYNLAVLTSEGKAYEPIVWLGQNSLIIMILHYFGMKLVSALIVYGGYADISTLWQTPTIMALKGTSWWIAYTVVGLAIPIGYILIKNKIKQIKT